MPFEKLPFQPENFHLTHKVTWGRDSHFTPNSMILRVHYCRGEEVLLSYSATLNKHYLSHSVKFILSKPESDYFTAMQIWSLLNVRTEELFLHEII